MTVLTRYSEKTHPPPTKKKKKKKNQILCVVFPKRVWELRTFIYRHMAKHRTGMRNGVIIKQWLQVLSKFTYGCLCACVCVFSFKYRTLFTSFKPRQRKTLFRLISIHLKLSRAKRICVFEHSVMTNFNCACPAIQRGQGSGFLSEGSSWLTACMSEQRRFWRDCADAQARLNLRCSHRR